MKRDFIENSFFLITSENFKDIDSFFVGYCIYKDKLYLKYNKALENIMGGDKTFGFFTYVKKQDNEIQIIRDSMGLMPLYLFQNEKNWAISNSFWKLFDYVSKKNALHLNKGFAECLFSFGMMPYVVEETLCDEIKVLSIFADIYIDIKTGLLSIQTPDKLAKKVSLESKEGMAILDEWISDWSYLAKQLEKSGLDFRVDLSGGYDSRVSFAIAKAGNVDFSRENMYLYSFMPKDEASKSHFKNDYGVAKRIADIYEIKLTSDSYKIGKYKDLSTIDRYYNYKNTLFGSEAQVFDRKFLYEKPLIYWTGHLGESIRGYRFDVDTILRQACIYKLNPLENIALGYGCQSIMKSYNTLSNYVSEHSFNAEDIKVRLCMETLDKIFFGKQLEEYCLNNIYIFTPFMDIRPRMISIPSGIDPKILYVVVLKRISPELLNLPFNEEKKFSQDLIKYADELCKKYPSRVKYFSETKTLDIENDVQKRIYSFDNDRSINDILYQKFLDPKTKEYMEKYFGERGLVLYNTALKRYHTSNIFHNETYMSCIVAIAETANKCSLEDMDECSEKTETDILAELTAKYPKYETIKNMYKISKEQDYILNLVKIASCNRNKDIYLYGAGNYGKLLAMELNDRGIKIKGFLVSKRNNNPNEIYGYPVYTLAEYKKSVHDYVIPAVSERYLNEVRSIINTLKERENE